MSNTQRELSGGCPGVSMLDCSGVWGGGGGFGDLLSYVWGMFGGCLEGVWMIWIVFGVYVGDVLVVLKNTLGLFRGCLGSA